MLSALFINVCSRYENRLKAKKKTSKKIYSIYLHYLKTRYYFLRTNWICMKMTTNYIRRNISSKDEREAKKIKIKYN